MLRFVLTSVTLCLLSFVHTGAVSSSNTTLPALENKTTVTDPKTSTALTFEEKLQAFEVYSEDIYDAADLKGAGLSYEVFHKAFIGHQNLKSKGLASKKKSIITVIDFTKSSKHKRLWVIDLNAKKILKNTLVAHGKNSGEEKALKFSNVHNSYMSSMGFYVTDKTYYGKHGLSLKLSGVDKAFNSNAMTRAIVMHGADYVSEEFIKQYGRLGRSLGCPAIPQAVTKEIIGLVKDNTCLYIHTADKKYNSDYLNQAQAVESFALEMPLLATNS